MSSRIPKNVKNPKLYKKIKSKIRKDVDKKNRQWGAYDSGRLVKEYKKAGGTLTSEKNQKNSPLNRWYKEKWINVCQLPKKIPCGRPKIELKSWKKKFPYCRPSIRVTKSTPKIFKELTTGQIKSRCKKKKIKSQRKELPLDRRVTRRRVSLGGRVPRGRVPIRNPDVIR